MAVTINGSAGVTTNSGAVYNGLQTDTAKSATGTSIDFTSIPSWVKRITVMLGNVSTSGASLPLVQLGDSGGVENTGYLSCGTYIAGSNGFTVASTAGFNLTGFQAAEYVMQGALTISLLNASTNTWAASGTFSVNNNVSTAWAAGSKSLSSTLDRVRITTVNGTDTFDAGTINIIYE